MIAVALPDLMASFRVSITSAAWLITGYLVVMGCTQPVGGRLGDRLGRPRLLLGGLAAFGLASFAATLAPSFSVLVLFRLCQALSGALVVPNSVALLREAIPAERRGRAYGVVGVAIGFGAAAGPPLSGVLIRIADWRALFMLNVPLVAVALLLGWRSLPRSHAQPTTRRESGPDLRLFAVRSFGAATAAVALSNLSMYCLLLAVPQLLAREGWDSVAIGLALLPLSAGLVLLGLPGGWLADRLGRRWPVVTGLGLLAAGSFAVILAVAVASHLWLVAALAVVGAGLGVAQGGLQSAAVEAVGPNQAGSAAGLFSSARYLGSIVGSSLLALMLSSGGGFNSVFLMVAGSAVLSLVLSFGLSDWPEKARRSESADLVPAIERSLG